MQSPYDRIQYYNFNEEQKANLVSKLKALLAEDSRIQSAWIFGSFTRRGSVRDIDVAIRAKPKITFKEYLDLNVEIELELGLPADLVEINKVPTALKDTIIKNGTLIKNPKNTDSVYFAHQKTLKKRSSKA